MKLYIAHCGFGLELGTSLDGWNVEDGFLSDHHIGDFDSNIGCVPHMPKLEIGEYTIIEFEKPFVVARVGELSVDKNLCASNNCESPPPIHMRRRTSLPYNEKDVLWERKRHDDVTTVCLDSGERFRFNKQGDLL